MRLLVVRTGARKKDGFHVGDSENPQKRNQIRKDSSGVARLFATVWAGFATGRLNGCLGEVRCVNGVQRKIVEVAFRFELLVPITLRSPCCGPHRQGKFLTRLFEIRSRPAMSPSQRAQGP